MNNSIQTITGSIGIYFSIHYFYSYMWFKKFFALHGLETFAILTFEDVTYSFGEANYQIIVISSVGMIWAWIWMLMDFKIQIGSNPFQNFSIKRMSKSAKWGILTCLLIGAGLLTWLYVYWFPKLDSFIIGFIILILGCPIFCSLYNEKKTQIFATFWVFSIVWGVKFIDQVILETQKNGSQSTSRFTFCIDGEQKGANKRDYLVYHGYKYIIIGNYITKECQLYPTDQVSNQKYYK